MLSVTCVCSGVGHCPEQEQSGEAEASGERTAQCAEAGDGSPCSPCPAWPLLAWLAPCHFSGLSSKFPSAEKPFLTSLSQTSYHLPPTSPVLSAHLRGALSPPSPSLSHSLSQPFSLPALFSPSPSVSSSLLQSFALFLSAWPLSGSTSRRQGLARFPVAWPCLAKQVLVEKVK